jgi:MFS transporter, DHA2 family, methylenomycin A resistance protein
MAELGTDPRAAADAGRANPVPPASPHTRLILFLSIAQFVVTTDFTMVGIVLPRIATEFAVGAAAASGLVAVNALVYASLLMAGGRLADLWGQRRCCVIGLSVFGIGTLLVMASTSLPLLLVARALQGTGAALISPATFSLMNTAVPAGPERHRAYRIFGSFQGASMIAGPVLGGGLTTLFGWRSAYLLEVALVGVLLAAVRSAVPIRPVPSSKGRFDTAGAVLIGCVIVLFVAAIAGIGGLELGIGERFISAMLAVVLFLLLRNIERRSTSPLIPPAVLRQPRVATASMGMMAAMASSTAFFLLPNVLMQQILGWSAAAAGLGMLPHAVAAIIAGQAIGYSMGRFDLPRNISIAFCLIIVALLLYAWLPQPMSYLRSILIPMLIGGAGSLFSLMILMADAAAPVGESEQGVVSALAYTSQQMGIAIGSAVILSAASSATATGLYGALRHAFLLAAGIALVGLTCAVGVRHALLDRGPLALNPRE